MSVRQRAVDLLYAMCDRTNAEEIDVFLLIITDKCSCFLPVQTERDVSVRQRAVDLLYAMCDRTNAEEIVGEMLEYLETADYSIREEMVGYEPRRDKNCLLGF